MQHYVAAKTPQGVYFHGVRRFCIRCKIPNGQQFCPKCIKDDLGLQYKLARTLKKCLICRATTVYGALCDPCFRYNTIYSTNEFIAPADRKFEIPNIKLLIVWAKQILGKDIVYQVINNVGNSVGSYRYDPTEYYYDSITQSFPEEFKEMECPLFPDLWEKNKAQMRAPRKKPIKVVVESDSDSDRDRDSDSDSDSDDEAILSEDSENNEDNENDEEDEEEIEKSNPSVATPPPNLDLTNPILQQLAKYGINVDKYEY